jgi:hypothetical protein
MAGQVTGRNYQSRAGRVGFIVRQRDGARRLSDCARYDSQNQRQAPLIKGPTAFAFCRGTKRSVSSSRQKTVLLMSAGRRERSLAPTQMRCLRVLPGDDASRRSSQPLGAYSISWLLPQGDGCPSCAVIPAVMAYSLLSCLRRKEG